MTKTEPSRDLPRSNPRPPRGRKRAPAGRAKRPETPRAPEHLNARPSWDCLVCGEAWPCAAAQKRLLREFRRFPSVLCVYMNAKMCDAVSDLLSTDHVAPPDLYERFLTWTRTAGVDARGNTIYGRNELPELMPLTAAVA